MAQRTNRVLGIDPSLNRSGWAILEPHDDLWCLTGAGVIVPHGADRSRQLESISSACRRVLSRHTPAQAILEQPGAWQRRGGSRRETIEAMAMARGVMLAACAEANIVAMEAPVQQVRRTLVGRHNASTAEVIQYLQGRGVDLPRRPRGAVDGDIANAILMALYGVEILTAGAARPTATAADADDANLASTS